MLPLATLQSYLAQAYEARHRLMTGEREVSLSHTILGSQSVAFQAADPDKLDGYIRRLEGMVAQASGRGRRCYYIT